MRAILVAMLCMSLAACSSTAGGAAATGPAAQKTTTSAGADRKTPAARKKDACEEAVQAQANAAMLSGALGMVGGLGGLGGRGGMVAGQVASAAGSIVASGQSAKARAEVMQECY